MDKQKSFILSIIVVILFITLFFQDQSNEEKNKQILKQNHDLVVSKQDSIKSLSKRLKRDEDLLFIYKINTQRYEMIYEALNKDPYCKKKIESISPE